MSNWPWWIWLEEWIEHPTNSYTHSLTLVAAGAVSFVSPQERKFLRKIYTIKTSAGLHASIIHLHVSEWVFVKTVRMEGGRESLAKYISSWHTFYTRHITILIIILSPSSSHHQHYPTAQLKSKPKAHQLQANRSISLLSNSPIKVCHSSLPHFKSLPSSSTSSSSWLKTTYHNSPHHSRLHTPARQSSVNDLEHTPGCGKWIDFHCISLRLSDIQQSAPRRSHPGNPPPRRTSCVSNNNVLFFN